MINHSRIVLLTLASLVLFIPLVSSLPILRANAAERFERLGGGPISPPVYPSPTPTPPITPPVGPSPTPTPFPSASPTPVPSPRPTPSPTPNPTAKPNHVPVVSTTSLPAAKVGVDYWIHKAEVVATDKDSRDSLTMTIANLPTGMRQGPCNSKNTGSARTISCWIIGKPTTAGNKVLTIMVTDNHGSVGVKNIPLSVSK